MCKSITTIKSTVKSIKKKKIIFPSIPMTEKNVGIIIV